MAELLDGTKYTVGTCYYPEHWDKSLWEQDLKRMKEVGIEVIRIAEFSWSLTEPREGEFTYDFWDEFLDLCEKVQMKVIFGTPTATPPAWLTEKYEEVLNARIDGTLIRHGERRHYNYNSKIYIEKTKIIVEKLAGHYAKRSCIIGWQIDNEINCETDEFYSESDDTAFREWVKEKYKTIEKVNEAWGTVFWNQTYTDFNEIHRVRLTNQSSANPHQSLDYRRFISDSARKYVKIQSDILRKYIKENDFITTNGMFNLDNHAMNKESLDFFSYDSYPDFAFDEYYEKNNNSNLRDRVWSRNLAVVRSVSEPFGIMEQQSGAGGWHSRMMMPAPRPGQIRLWTMQSVAHGAEFINYFRWRTSTMGNEIYWHGILDYSGKDNRRLREVKQTCDDLKKISNIAGSKYIARVAVIRTWDNEFDAQIDKWHGLVEKISQDGIFAASIHSHTPIDYIYIEDDTSIKQLEKYELLIFPHAVMVSNKQESLLEKYVENGGKLLLGARAGLKETTGKCTMEELPGKFRKLTGCIVDEFTIAPPDSGAMYVVPCKDASGEIADAKKFRISAQGFYDKLMCDDNNSKVLGVYDSTYLAGEAAFIMHSYGRGKVFSYGSTFSEDTMSEIYKMLSVYNPYSEYIELPNSCELAVRSDGIRTYFIILNYDKTKCEITFKKEVEDMLQGGMTKGKYYLPAYGIAVVAPK
ncbi:beta-galactosidase [Butyrivibrio sp. NC3005]|uniref:beta-galactosidase n=1 Tax=Butyrivibrio sp. NC3005 TaxID=1280685 RepID=UPI00041F8E08|nr:beta-galactosidase [Butyrivibrio sp. NC3005]